MSVQQYKQVGYGLTQALTPLAFFPIISKRAPLTTDKAQLGTIWVDVPADAAYILVAIVNNEALWTGIGGGTGDFTSIIVTGQSFLSGEIFGSDGMEMVEGNILVDEGNITATVGNIVATAGAVSAGTTITAAGNIVSTGGNIICDTGNIIVTTGDIAAGSTVAGAGLITTGDPGSGVSAETTFTNATNTTQGAGTLTIKSASANPGTNTGFIKIYVGTGVAYIPYYTTIAP